MTKELNFDIGQINHGFRATRNVELNELGAVLHQMEHEKTGLQLVWLDRAEENKTFAITFETLPWDDTGVFHILEHSVLCGSDRYPVKEPFVELLKNSMNTFLNAMTFPDKTMYPVSSKNSQDFINLMRVYMDAVLHPAIYHKPEIFMQEGWHYDVSDDGEVTYKGVVFNEMKGAMADAGEIMETALNRAMFPDTPYAYVSGGDPVSIPNLSYENFIKAHGKFYSPANGTIFLDGAMDIDNVLAIINDEFLDDFEKGERIAPPEYQKPIDGGVQRVQYEIGADEPIEERMRMAWGRGLCRFDDREKIIAMDILAEVLSGNNEAYLNKLILERGLAEDVILRAYDGIAQPWVKLEVRNFREENSGEIESILFDEMRRLVDEGIDRDKLEAIMANQEFLMEERDFGTYPQGLFMGFLVMDSMLYGGAPEQNLEKGDLFDRLRQKMEDGYFEELLREVMLDNKHKCQVILEPSVTLGEERRADEASRIKNVVSGWSEAEHAKVSDDMKRLLTWQASEDRPEDLEMLPHLTIADMDDAPEDIPTVVKRINGIEVVRHTIETSDVRYVNLYFEIPEYNKQKLSELSFLVELLGTLGTGNIAAEDMVTVEQSLLGRMDYDLLVYARNNDKAISSVQFIATISVLEEKAEKAIEFITDILTNTNFEETSKILDVMKQCKQEKMQSFIMGGNSAAMRRVMAMGTCAGAAQESITGYDYYRWMCDQLDNWDGEKLSNIMASHLNNVINKDKMTISITANSEYDETNLVSWITRGIKSSVKSHVGSEATEVDIVNDIKPNGFRREGVVIPADIAFTVRGGDLAPANLGFSGKMQVASRIVGLAYLWNMVRVKGGAYGTGMSVHPSGILSCYSYRDPNGATSLETFKGSADFLRQLATSDDMDLTGFIIGAVSDASPLLTPRLKAQIGDSFYFRGMTFQDRCKTRKELLSTTREDLISLANGIEMAMSEGGYCIVGSKEQVEAAGELDEILKL